MYIIAINSAIIIRIPIGIAVNISMLYIDKIANTINGIAKISANATGIIKELLKIHLKF